MSDFLPVLLYAGLPVLGHLIGTLLAESVRAPKWVIGAALHGAAGIAIALVSIDLLPRILDKLSIEAIVIAFLLGALTSVLLAGLVRGLESGRRGAGGTAAWMVLVAVGADLASDGLMTGAGAAIGGGLGLLLAASQSVANIPGGFAAVSNLRGRGISRLRRVGMSVAMILPVVVSAVIGFTLLSAAPPFYRDSSLAFIAGVLLLATIEDVVPQADAPEPKRWISTASFAGGFAGMALLSADVG